MNFHVTSIKPFGALVEPLTKGTRVQNLDLKSLHQLFLKEQIVVLRGFETFQSSEDFANYCERWGEVSVWPFGKVLELVEQDNPQDHIFDHSYVPLHWDGMYRPFVPEYQIFHCVKAPKPNQAGRTTFSNTLLALKNLSPKLKEQWSQVTGVYKRKMEFYESVTVSPLITSHPFRDTSVIRYNEPPSKQKGKFVNPPDLEFLGVQDVEFFHSNVQEVLYSPQNFYAHEWQDKDVVITDNFSLLHGRESFTSKSPRHLQRVQVLSNPPYKNPGLESYK